MNVHFIAVGGSVMHNLAIALKRKGYRVSGSDDEIFEPAKNNLQTEGLLPEKSGWFPEKITTELDAIVLGMHAHADNPELSKARELGLKIYSFPEFIYEQSKNKRRIVIGGSHGKTSTTAMIMYILKNQHQNFDYMVGAAIPGFDITVKLSDDAPIILLEGDEYPDSAVNKTPKFHLYKADVGLITGIAWDHINIFPTFENYAEQFRIFAEQLPADGCLIFNKDDETLAHLVTSLKNRVTKVSYQTPEYGVKNNITTVRANGENYPLEIFGKHNLQNAAGAVAVCCLLGITTENCWQALQTFPGAARRLEQLGRNDSCIVFKDFAHSPSKLNATIAAVREQFAERKIVACMELHTYSSLSKNFLEQYRNCMQQADIKIVFYNQHTFELKRMEAFDEAFVREAFGGSDLKIFTDASSIRNFLEHMRWNNSVLLLMSSGNFGGMDLSNLTTFVLSHS